MSTITLPNIRVGSDLQVRVRLKDGGMAIDWSTLNNVKAYIYSDAQRAMAGRCSVSVDEEDTTLLVCNYAASKPQYLGANRIVIQANYMGETKTYDKPVFSYVRWTADQEGEEITIEDPDVDVEINVEDVSSSILQEVLAACIKATEEAKDVVDVHRGPRGFSAYELAVQDGFEGTEEEWLESLQGETGPQGPQGEQGETGPAGVTDVDVRVDHSSGVPAGVGHVEDGLLTLQFTGLKGQSAYEVAVANGFEGTEEEWLASLVGPQGQQGVKGDTGAKGDKGDTGETGPQGIQGNTGSSVEYPYELVNNRTTDDATKGLSAAEGKRLGDDLSQLEAELNGFSRVETASFDITAGAANTYNTGDYADIDLPASTYRLTLNDDTIVKPGSQLWVKYSGDNTWTYIDTLGNLPTITLQNAVTTVGIWAVAANSLKTATLVLTFTDTASQAGLIDKVADLEDAVEDLEDAVEGLPDLSETVSDLEGTVSDIGDAVSELEKEVLDGEDNSVDFVQEVTETDSFGISYPVDIKAGTYRLTYTNTIVCETGTYIRYYFSTGATDYEQTANIGASGDKTKVFSRAVVAIRIKTYDFVSAGTITMHFDDTNKVASIKDTVDGLVTEVADNSADIAELQGIVGVGGTEKYLRATGNITTGQSLSLGENNVETNKHLSFVGYFSSFGTLRIGHGYNLAESSCIEIDSTNIKVFRGASTTAVMTKVHGLTIQNNIQVSITVDDVGVPTITVQSMGERYSFANYMWYGTRGSIFAESVSGTYTDCVLSWTCNGYDSDVHIYGDSYCGNLNQERWPYYMLQDGYNDILLDAYGGRASTNALSRFLENIEHSTPKYALWLMGMNDADTNSAINATWLTKVQDFITKCNEKAITPILCTIPNVPSRVMTFKNAWVKASGYRYIDFAKAVNAESAGATWYTGMLDDDEVHPSALGAKTLYFQVLADFPELMFIKKVTIGGAPSE